MEGKIPPGGQESHDQLPLPLPPGREKLETYVVQIPREQVYRVPPPEHARIIESYLKPGKEKKRNFTYCTWVLLAIAVIALIIGVSIGVTRLLYNPKSPHFSVTKIVAKIPSPSKYKQKGPRFEVLFKANNPNERMGISYKKGGKTSLSFKNDKVAKGDFPSFSQESKDSTLQEVTLAASRGALPKEIERGINSTTITSKTKKKGISLGFTINVPIEFTSWARNVQKGMTVSCDFKVNNLGTGSKILSQQCSTKI
ncbi:hypothetical protein LguiB_032671 [Lonicera macranthoides]